MHKIQKHGRHKENQPPQIHGGVQGEGRRGDDAGEPDAARAVQQGHGSRQLGVEIGISYIPMKYGFMYLFAIIDVYQNPCDICDEPWKGMMKYF